MATKKKKKKITLDQLSAEIAELRDLMREQAFQAAVPPGPYGPGPEEEANPGIGIGAGPGGGSYPPILPDDEQTGFPPQAGGGPPHLPDGTPNDYFPKFPVAGGF